MLVLKQRNAVDTVTGILHYIIAGILILNQNTIWRFLQNAPETFGDYVTIALLVAVSVCLVLKLVWNPEARASKGFIAPSFILMYMTVFLLLNGFFPYYYMQFAVSFFALGLYFFICNKKNYPEALKAYSNIMTAVAVVSVILWVLCSMIKVIPASGTVLTSWSSEAGYSEINNFFGIYFEPQTVKFLGHRFIRNSAFFAEGPMASLAFSIGLLSELLLAKKPNLIKIIILFIGVFSTFSVTGIMICVAAIIIKLIFSFLVPAVKKIQNAAKRKGLVIGIVCVIVLAVAFVVYIAAFRMSTDSASIRMDDMKSGLKAFRDAPIIGNGFMNDYSIQAYMGSWRGGNLGFSNSVTQILAHGGLYLGLLYLVPFAVGLVNGIRKRAWSRVLFVICTFVLFCMSIFTYSYTLIFLLYFIAFSIGGDSRKA